jgi:hypothetical protein
MSDPVAWQARMIAAAFRQKGLGDVSDMIDYLADRADEQWDATTAKLARTARPTATADEVREIPGDPA